VREFMIILEREFRERVQTRSFFIGTLLFPVFLVAIVLMSAGGGDSDERRTLAVVDRAPAGVADVFTHVLTTSIEDLMAAAEGAGGTPPTPRSTGSRRSSQTRPGTGTPTWSSGCPVTRRWTS
jgi:hypothetical protein